MPYAYMLHVYVYILAVFLQIFFFFCIKTTINTRISDTKIGHKNVTTHLKIGQKNIDISTDYRIGNKFCARLKIANRLTESGT